jgi:hypothetical protein
MTIKYNWSISQLDRRTSDNFVTTAHWRCDATDEEFSASVYATCGWSEGSPVINYQDLTQDEVLSWVMANVGKDTVEASLTAQIEAQKNPVQETGLPWVTA